MAFAGSPLSRVDRVATRLTQTNRSAGREHGRRRPTGGQATNPGRLDRSICRGCGSRVGTDQRWCEMCRPAAKLAAGLDGLASGRALRAQLRKAGRDPSASPKANAKRGFSMRQRIAEQRAWEHDNPAWVDRELFDSDVLPRIQGVPVRQLAKLTGLSVGYCGLISKGAAKAAPEVVAGSCRRRTHPPARSGEIVNQHLVGRTNFRRRPHLRAQGCAAQARCVDPPDKSAGSDEQGIGFSAGGSMGGQPPTCCQPQRSRSELPDLEEPRCLVALRQWGG